MIQPIQHLEVFRTADVYQLPMSVYNKTNTDIQQANIIVSMRANMLSLLQPSSVSLHSIFQPPSASLLSLSTGADILMTGRLMQWLEPASIAGTLAMNYARRRKNNARRAISLARLTKRKLSGKNRESLDGDEKHRVRKRRLRLRDMIVHSCDDHDKGRDRYRRAQIDVLTRFSKYKLPGGPEEILKKWLVVSFHMSLP